jgi:hypothetical protein
MFNTKGSERIITLLALYPATLQNIRTKTDARRLVLFIIFSSFQHLTDVPHQEARRKRKRMEPVLYKNNKTHRPEPVV